MQIEEKIHEGNRGNDLKLISAVRIIIYSFMTFSELMDKICKISKEDRAMLTKK